MVKNRFKLAVVAVAVALLLPAVANADGYYLDRSGGYAGSWEGDSNYRIYRDRDGGYAGSAERYGGGWVFKDKAGGYAGSSRGSSDHNPFLEEEE
jgi:hypothetical protein